jgi:O-methyltransferase
MVFSDVKKMIRGLVRRIGFDIVRYQPHQKPVSLADFTDREIEIIESVKPYTLTSEERIRVDYTCRVAVRTGG